MDVKNKKIANCLILHVEIMAGRLTFNGLKDDFLSYFSYKVDVLEMLEIWWSC